MHSLLLLLGRHLLRYLLLMTSGSKVLSFHMIPVTSAKGGIFFRTISSLRPLRPWIGMSVVWGQQTEYQQPPQFRTLSE